MAEGVTVTLDGSSSTGGDSSIRSYSWEQLSGPTVNLLNPGSEKSTFIVPAVSSDGTSMEFKLTVTNRKGVQASDNCVINISYENKPPIADAGKPQEVSEGDTVSLSAEKSVDPDDGIESYQWSQISGTSVVLSSQTSPTPSFYVPDVGKEGDTLTFRLTVKDKGGLTSSASCSITVKNRNQAPVANAGADQTVPEGTSVSLNGVKSSDIDGDNLSYVWTQTGGTSVSLSSTLIAAPTFSTPDVGPDGETLTFRLTVTDQNGLTSTDSCSVKVLFVNQSPIADAGESQSVKEGNSAELNGEKSTDSDDGIVTYFWEQVAGPKVQLTDPFGMKTSFIAPDVDANGIALTFRLTVTDKGGLKSTDACLVNVTFVNEAPNANAGAEQIVSGGSLTTLNAGNSTDKDNNIASYLWEQVSGTGVTLSDTSSVRPTFTAPNILVEEETLVFKVTVSDTEGLSSSDTCSVRVVFNNQAPVADAGNAQTVSEGSTVSLDGTGSVDPDDGIKSYFWEKIAGPDVTLANASSATPEFIAPDVGSEGISLTFQLTVTDNGGLQSTDACIVNVTFINTAPIADAGANQVVTEKSQVTLTAVNSKDSDDGIASYQWQQTEGTTVSLSDSSAVSPTFEAPAISGETLVLTFSVTVTDKNGLQSSDISTVTVVADGGTSVTLLWDLNEDADYYIVYWGKESGNYSENSPNINSPETTYTVTGLDQAVYYFSVKAFNNCGNSSDFSEEIVYNFSADSQTQVASDDSAPASQTGSVQPLPEGVTTDGDTTDKSEVQSSDISTDTVIAIGGTSVSLLWDLNEDADYYIVYWGKESGNYSENSPNINSPETTYTISGLDQAVYYFSVKAFNNCGNSSDFSEEIVYNFSADSQTQVASDDSAPVSQTGSVQPLPEGVTADGDTVVAESDVTQPVSPENLISYIADSPSIEYLDVNLKHREWLQTGWAEYNNLNGEARVAAGDIDGDGEDEIIIGFASVPGNQEIPGGFFQILDHDFTHLAWGRINWPEYNAVNGETWPVCGDINDDGDDEIIIGLGEGGEGTLEVFDYDADGLFHSEWIISSWTDYNTLIGETRPAAGDVDGDGFEEIIIGLASGADNSSIPGGYFEVIESDYTHAAWGNIEWQEYNSVNGETRLTCGDITGNGSYEIIAGLGSGGNGRVEVFEFYEKAVLHIDWFQIDWAEYNGLNGETRPCASDIDNDGKDEIILGLGPVNENDTIPGGRYQVNDDDFSLIEWLQLDWDFYNRVNGSTRPVNAVINESQSFLIGLGEK